MLLLVLAMLTATVLGVAVVGYVAVPAHRGGRGLLTQRGLDVALSVRRRFAKVGTRARTH
ncbi:hypothetical protein ACWEOW_07465 [Monashia sp. NPDC004114]